MITQETKQQIINMAESKRGALSAPTSQNKLAEMLKISPALYSQMLKGNWQSISDEKWKRVAEWAGFYDKDWATAETTNYNTIMWYLDYAQTKSEVFAIIAPPGHSKTFTGRKYCEVNGYAWQVKCKEHWNKKAFLGEILTLMGIGSDGMSVTKMMQAIVSHIRACEFPCLIDLDEFDKVDDRIFCFFIDLYNELEDKCGLVITGTDYLKKRIMRGIELNKKGYKEVYSRLGGKFIVLKENTPEDIAKVCTANGADDQKIIAHAVNDSKADLRRVKRIIKKSRELSAEREAA